MIDLIYKTLLTVINKENNGYVSPTEFNVLANAVQKDIFRDYFSDQSRSDLKQSRALMGSGHGDVSKNNRFKIQQFTGSASVKKGTDKYFMLPEDLYYLMDGGVSTSSNQKYPNKLVEEVEPHMVNYLSNSIAKPTQLRPVYVPIGPSIRVHPDEVTNINIQYIREPKMPNWTSVSIGGVEMFNPADSSFQDFELHVDEFSDILLRMLLFFGISIREQELMQTVEVLKDKMKIKDDN